MDKREDILARLVEVAAGIEGVANVFRNKIGISEASRPAILIYDADEEGVDEDPTRTRPPNAPRRVGLTPECLLMLGGKHEQVGTDLNALRAKFLKAVLTDAEMRTILGTNGAIVYEGCATGLAIGRNMEGEMGVSITFIYVLFPDQL